MGNQHSIDHSLLCSNQYSGMEVSDDLVVVNLIHPAAWEEAFASSDIVGKPLEAALGSTLAPIVMDLLNGSLGTKPFTLSGVPAVSDLTCVVLGVPGSGGGRCLTARSTRLWLIPQHLALSQRLFCSILGTTESACALVHCSTCELYSADESNFGTLRDVVTQAAMHERRTFFHDVTITTCRWCNAIHRFQASRGSSGPQPLSAGSRLNTALSTTSSNSLSDTSTTRSAPVEGSSRLFRYKSSFDLKTALIVASDASQREMLSQVVEQCGFFAVAVVDAVPALAHVVHGCQTDLVVTDVVLRRMSGIELIRELRRLHVMVPIIAVAGTTMFSNMAIEAGAQAFFTSSATPIEMKRVVLSVADLPSTKGVGASSRYMKRRARHDMNRRTAH